MTPQLIYRKTSAASTRLTQLQIVVLPQRDSPLENEISELAHKNANLETESCSSPYKYFPYPLQLVSALEPTWKRASRLFHCVVKTKVLFSYLARSSPRSPIWWRSLSRLLCVKTLFVCVHRHLALRKNNTRSISLILDILSLLNWASMTHLVQLGWQFLSFSRSRLSLTLTNRNWWVRIPWSWSMTLIHTNVDQQNIWYMYLKGYLSMSSNILE